MALSQKNLSFLTDQAVHKAVLTPRGSKTFIKKLIPVAVSFILHQRANFDKDEFDTRTYKGVIYKRLKKKLRYSTLKDVSNWIKGALDAFDKNYLREIYLLFCNQENPSDVYESYKFQFKYMGNDVIPLDPPATKQNIAASTDALLKVINSLDQYALLKQDEFVLKMALTYYEDVTPPNYEPPFYGNKDNNAKEIITSLSAHSKHYLRLGFFHTGFHIVKCRAKGDVFAIDQPLSNSAIDLVDGDLEPTEETNIDSMLLSGNNSIEGPSINAVDDYREIKMEICSLSGVGPTELEDSQIDPKIIQLDANKFVSETDLLTASDHRDEDVFKGVNKIQCIPAEFHHVDLVMCSHCLNLQHAACMGYLYSVDIADKYLCQMCQFGSALTADQLKRKQQMSIYRLAVAYAYFTKQFPEDVLSHVSSEIRILMLKKLKSLQIISEKDGKYKINMKLIRTTYLKELFQKNKTNVLPASMSLDDDSFVFESISQAKKRKYL